MRSAAAPFESDDIVVLADEAWDSIWRQRHKLPRSWALAGNRVLWVEQAPFPGAWLGDAGRRRAAADAVPRRVPLPAGAAGALWVGCLPPAMPFQERGGALGRAVRALAMPAVRRRVRALVRGAGLAPRALVLWQQPAYAALLGELGEEFALYATHDPYRYGRATGADLELERELCGRVRAVIATSEARAEELRRWNPRTARLGPAVDVDWWEARTRSEPTALARIPRPRALFVSALRPAVDFALLAETARHAPGWSFILAGPRTGDAEVRRGLAAMPGNVHLPGRLAWEESAAWMAGADALLLPYRCLPELGAVGLPHKFFEYCIAGAPILATPFCEFDREARGVLRVAADAAGWAAQLEEILWSPDDDGRSRRQAIARANSYGERLAELRALLGEQGAG
ncbi:MAG: glycosyltransferase [Candidatus Sumerlaeia bacterium]|nr:glycosyltransferase [Candidatus Sumerlaeia bacterium]